MRSASTVRFDPYPVLKPTSSDDTFQCRIPFLHWACRFRFPMRVPSSGGHTRMPVRPSASVNTGVVDSSSPFLCVSGESYYAAEHAATENCVHLNRVPLVLPFDSAE